MQRETLFPHAFMACSGTALYVVFVMSYFLYLCFASNSKRLELTVSYVFILYQDG
jgi:hypothetical protein